MNRFSKTISSSCRPQIENLKNQIRFTTHQFDGDGYVFKTAIKELRKEGLRIVLDRKTYMYKKEIA